MDFHEYEILDIQRYNSNTFHIQEVNIVLRDKDTGIRTAIQKNTADDLYLLTEIAVKGDTLFISFGEKGKKTMYALSCEDGSYMVKNREVVCIGKQVENPLRREVR